MTIVQPSSLFKTVVIMLSGDKATIVLMTLTAEFIVQRNLIRNQ